MKRVVLIAAVTVFSALGLLTAEFAVAAAETHQLDHPAQLTTLPVESR